jgi:NAD(P)-dependent dehydrogenase (short-subunit alcohol dehydrogenase family)
MPLDALADKSIVIIGGTTGLGLSAAHAFVAAGAGVVIVGRNQRSLDSALAALGRSATGFAGDAIDSKAAERAVALAVKRFGQLDGLYHVAGGSGRRWGDGPLHALPDEACHLTIELNLYSLIWSNRAAIRQFLAQKSGGTILNLSSVLGYSPSPQFFATHAYAAAKSAVLGFTQSIAAYYAPENIRCNVLAPGLIETPMAERATKNPELMRFIKTKQPLDKGRIGRPSDLDAAAVYFMSDASRFATGQVMAVDGGWSVSEGAAKSSFTRAASPSARARGRKPASRRKS